MARTLVDLKGIYVAITNQQAREIQQLYQDLLEYDVDKRPLVFKRIDSENITPPPGRFGRSKTEGGRINVDSMKRYTCIS